MESDDPYNFTIQQTIDTLSPLLDESHKLSFRSNEITGRVLLNTASFKTLKEELAVIPLGRREGIMAIVKQLRQQSPLYQENLQSIAVATPLPSDEEEERLIGCLELAYQPNVAGKKRKRKRDEQPPGDILEGWVELPCTERFEKPDMVPAMGEPATEQRLDSPAREPALELWNRDGPLIVRNPWGEENATASWVDRYGVLRDSKFSGSEEENEHSISGLCVETKPQDLNQSVLQCESGDEEFYSPVESVDVGPKRIAPTNIGPVMEEMEAGETSPDEGSRIVPVFIEPLGGDEIFSAVEEAPMPSFEAPADATSDVEMEAQVPETVPGPKRIAPTLIAPIRISESPEPEPEPTKRKNSARSSKYYLPLKGRKIETLFYEQPVKADIDLESDENDSNFVAPGLTNFPGERRYVGRRITRFLKDNSQIIDDIQSDRHFATGSASGQLVRVTTEDNQIRYAVKHYGNPDRFLRKYENQSFTVFDFGPSGVKAHRESNKTLKLPWPTANQTKAAIASNSDIQIVRHADRPKNSPPALDLDSNSNHDWDYLLKWNNIDGGDKILPVFGESDDENEYDSETWKEIQAENGPQSKALKSRHQKYLSPDEIKEAIEESIQELVLKWREKVLPKKEATAYRVWRKAKKEKNHRANIKAAQDGIKPLDERISKIREELLKSSMNWTKKDLVRKQVRGSMLQTVMDREDLKWYIKLMGRKEAPAKPLKKVQKPKRVDQQGNELPQENEEEADNEEEIGSSSDEDGFSEDEGDEMDGFIIGDPITLDDPMDTGPDEKDEGDEVSSVTAKTPQKSKLGKRTVVEDSQGDHDVPMSDVVDDYPMTNVMDDAPMPDASDGARYREKGTPDKIKDESKTPGPTVAASPAGTQVFIDLTTSTPSRYSTRDGITVIELESSEDEGDQPTPTPTQSKGKGKALVKEKKKRNQNREYLPESDSEGDGVSESGPGEEDEPVGKDDPVGEDGPSEKNDQGSDSDSADQLVQRYQMLNEMVVEDSESDNYPAFFHLQDVPAITIFDNQMIELQRVSFKNKTKRNGPPVRRLTRLYIAWTFLKKDATGHEKLPNSDLKILKQKNNFFVFLDHLWKILKNTYPKLVASSDTGRDVDFTTSAKPSFGISGSGGAGDSQHRKRKRKEVKEDPNAKATRQQAQHQAKIIQERRELARERGEEVGGGNVVVNYGHKEDLKDILIPEEIAKWGLKPHQITGIQFLWEQVVMGNQEAKLERCGGLLAHTMGLGKTLQVIAFLYTLAKAGASDDVEITKQIPEDLRKSKTLILAPPGLIDNWWEEFQKWLPMKNEKELKQEYIGRIYRADSIMSASARMKSLQQWNKDGGILLIGYAMFRTFVFPATKAIQDNEALREAKKTLLEGPNVIVADEAHSIKNPRAKISMAASMFRSRSRIAMTGSPLSNNLNEYWSMIEWIDPGYLGPEVEFRRKYVEPITDGIYADSSKEERRVSLTKLRALNEDIKIKIHRADINAILSDILPKTEFLITVPLTKLQSDMYHRFITDATTRNGVVEASRGNKGGKYFFNIISLLSLICSHPATFVKRIELSEAEAQKIISKSRQLAEEEEAEDEDPERPEDLVKSGVNDLNSGPNELLSSANAPYQWAREMLDSYKDSQEDLSFKMRAFRDILRFSIAEGDKVLVFSHSIPTLDVLEENIQELGFKYLRLDGKTKMSERQKSAKLFADKLAGIQVFIISTEAGGLGLNLPIANRVVIFDFKWTPTWEHQAIGRAFRLGQEKHVYVYRFRTGGTFEDNLWNTATFKTQLQKRVVDREAPIREARKKLSQYLAPPKDVPKQDITEFKAQDTVLARVIDEKDYICSVEQTETFKPDDEDVLTEQEVKDANTFLEQERNRRNVQNQLLSKAVPSGTPATPYSVASSSRGPPASAPISWENAIRQRIAAENLGKIQGANPLSYMPPPSATPVHHRDTGATSLSAPPPGRDVLILKLKGAGTANISSAPRNLPSSSHVVSDPLSQPPETPTPASRGPSTYLSRRFSASSNGPSRAKSVLKKVGDLNEGARLAIASTSSSRPSSSASGPSTQPPGFSFDKPVTFGTSRFGLKDSSGGLPKVFKGRRSNGPGGDTGGGTV